LGVATGSPLYVIQIKGDTRQVVVGNQEDLYSKTMCVKKINLISIAALDEPMRVQIKIRHRHEPASAQIEVSGTDEMLITFDEPQRAVTPGQAAVFYDGDVVVGGGWIA
jgi:tRNA-specific 2-thiouridylase